MQASYVRMLRQFRYRRASRAASIWVQPKRQRGGLLSRICSTGILACVPDQSQRRGFLKRKNAGTNACATGSRDLRFPLFGRIFHIFSARGHRVQTTEILMASVLVKS
jgi:hypothetical protein